MRIQLLLMAALAPSTAYATTTVVYGSLDPAAAIAQVQASDPDAGDLAAQTLSELLKDASSLVTGGTLQACKQTPTNMGALVTLQEQVEGMVGYMEFENALGSISRATESLGCLRDRMDESIAARLYFLEGIAAHGTGDPAGAKASFATALVFDPNLVWDDYFPPDAKSLMDLARTELDLAARAELSIAPAPDAGALWVDGRMMDAPGGSLSLLPGDHVVQLLAGRLRTFRVTLSLDVASVLVIPDAMGDERTDWVEDKNSQRDISAVLGATLTTETPLYFSTPDGVWKTVVGTSNWEEMEIPVEVVTSADLPAPSSELMPRVLTRGMVYTGAMVLGSGAVLSGVSYFKGSEFSRKADNAQSWELYYSHEESYENWQSRLLLGEGLVAAGLILSGGGFGLERLSHTQVTPWLTPGGGGMLIRRLH